MKPETEGKTEAVTTRALAGSLGVTVQAVNKWRRKAEKHYGCKLGSRSASDFRVTEFTAAEVQTIMEFANVPETVATVSEPDEETDAIEVEVLTPTETTGKTSTSLIKLSQSAAQAPMLTRFDSDDAADDLLAIRRQAQQAASNIDRTIQSYAAFRIDAVLNEIDATAEALKANAMATIQQRLGKPATGD